MSFWLNLRTGEKIPTGEESTARLEEEQAETRSLSGWTLQTSLDADWQSVTWAELYPTVRNDVYEMAFWCSMTPTGQQCFLLDAVQRGDERIAVKSGQGPGKTTITTLVGAWWAIRWTNSTTLLTAPSMHLAQKVWIAEFARTMRRAHPMIRSYYQIEKSKIRLGKNEVKYRNWLILPRTGASAEGIAGQHENHMNIIVEECSGMDDAIMETIFGTGSNEESDWNPDARPCSYLLIGNPTRCEGIFYRIFSDPREKADWTLLTFDAERSPLVSQKKVRREARIYGKQSAYYQIRVKGNFPDSSDNLLFRYEDLEVCAKVPVRRAIRRLQGEMQWGHDLARQGGDETVSYFRIGGAIIHAKVWPGVKGFEPAHAIRWAFRQDKTFEHTDSEEMCHCFDSVGVGQGVVYLFDEYSKNYFMFNAGGKAMKRRKFFNQITEAWFWLARLVAERMVYIPEDPVLWQQLTTRRYETHRDGRWLIEPKEKYLKRLSKGSPDRADAMVMCFYNISAGRAQIASRNDD